MPFSWDSPSTVVLFLPAPPPRPFRRKNRSSPASGFGISHGNDSFPVHCCYPFLDSVSPLDSRKARIFGGIRFRRVCRCNRWFSRMWSEWRLVSGLEGRRSWSRVLYLLFLFFFRFLRGCFWLAKRRCRGRGWDEMVRGLNPLNSSPLTSSSFSV